MQHKLKCNYQFKSRSKDRNKLCIVLAGYKPFLYSTVFSRLAKYLDDDIDVCIITSGLYSHEIDTICKNNEWSYLSTKENNVALVQNVAINLHPKAEYIFKLDEDIFITKDYFKNMYNSFMQIEKDSNYQIGFLAPLIPINGYAHLILLRKLGLEEYYTEHFEKPMFIAKPSRMIENSSDVARFFWGEGNIVPSIDAMNEEFSKDALKYTACPIRFSIGAILFKKSDFLAMGMFDVPFIRKSTSMGQDEAKLCSYCVKESKAMLVSENVLVGHLSFGRQNASMKDYYLANIDKFAVK